ncbi:uncharacterized protein N7458_011707 [Penicillium daleae]|uniref:Uncharacterized protein n=1 Tax=Penicillium daleae TaxID=63821 RepID=A0AAD6BV12_9EURO|nr:uncharacterized protein N7458_011707 [Penicillium daleae]KAJ5432551.1 hypothetical protein N7458_011707 [Penicillium daleae]
MTFTIFSKSRNFDDLLDPQDDHRQGHYMSTMWLDTVKIPGRQAWKNGRGKAPRVHLHTTAKKMTP